MEIVVHLRSLFIIEQSPEGVPKPCVCRGIPMIGAAAGRAPMDVPLLARFSRLEPSVGFDIAVMVNEVETWRRLQERRIEYCSLFRECFTLMLLARRNAAETCIAMTLPFWTLLSRHLPEDIIMIISTFCVQNDFDLPLPVNHASERVTAVVSPHWRVCRALLAEEAHAWELASEAFEREEEYLVRRQRHMSLAHGQAVQIFQQSERAWSVIARRLPPTLRDMMDNVTPTVRFTW